MPPLSHGQRSLWFLHHFAPGSGASNIAAAARVLSSLDADALERAFQALVDRHAALRTTFPAVDGEPSQQVADRLELGLGREDATGWSGERLRARLGEEAWRPFNLEQGPLLQVTLFTGGPERPVLLLVIHHIVADFWSLAVLLRELPELYREAAGGAPTRLGPPGLPYEEHVRREREALADGRGDERLAWWRETLADLPILELPTDRPRPPVRSDRGDIQRLRLPADLAASLRARGRAQHGTMFMTLVAALQGFLGRHTGQDDLAIGAPRAGRSQSDLAGTVGYFVNPAVLRGDLAGNPTFTELLERTRSMVQATFKHANVPLALLAERLQPERDPSRTPLFQVSFVLQKETRGVEGLTAFALGEAGVEVGPDYFRLRSLSLVAEDFFALGGHSLLATQVAARVRTVFGVELPVRSVFEAPTVEALARKLETARRPEGEEAPPPIVRGKRDRELPLSFAQERLWFIDQLEPGSALYNVPAAFRFSGPLEVPALAAGLREIVRRHEALRTVFTNEGGQPRQVILPESEVADLPVVDLSALPEALRDAQATRLAADEAVRPFDLARGPLARVALLRLGAEEHVALLNLHHIISDQWSLSVLVRELVELYAAARDGRPSSLPELPVQYADFAVWQRAWLSGATLDRELAWWRSALEGAPQALELPADRPRPATQSGRGGLRVARLPEAAAREIRGLARREGATTFMALQAAMGTLLSRLTGKRDLLLGTPVANRGRMEIEGLIGFFLNTLVLRMDLAGSPGLRDLLRRAREVSLAAFSHQDLPFERLVEELVLERHLSQTPLFQALLVVQSPERSLAVPGLTASRVEVGTGTSKFDLTLFVQEDEDGGLSAGLEYSRDLFDATTADRFLGQLGALLEGFAAAPDLPVERLPLLTPAERQALLIEWNDRQAAEEGLDLIGPLEAQAARTPDAAAVVWGEREITYRDFNAQANRLAHHLQRLGVGPGVAVAILLERSIEMIVGVVAVLKAGGPYVPLDPAYPAERLSFMLADSRARVLLTQESLLSAVPAPEGCTVLCLDRDAAVLEPERTDDPARQVDPDDLAYLIYTSGSTGLPKGVAMTHRALANLIEWQEADPALRQPARTLQFSSLSFDASFQEIVTALRRGGSLHLISEERRRDPRGLLKVLREGAVERLYLPFVALRQLAEAAQEPGEDASRLSLREVMTAGEQLQAVPALTRFFAALPQCRLHNYYGPSETHVVTVLTLGRDPEEWLPLPPIGRPIANTSIYLVDPEGELVPTGVPGELLIGGVSLARGYLDRPDTTAERFVPDPWSAEPGARLYRTGDLSRYRADGEIEFLGRIDHQVKIRGYRIEPGEIEAALAEHPAVRAAVVVVRDQPGRPGEKRLVAYAAAQEGMELRTADLRAFLRQRLPEYMVPSAFVLLERMPLTPSGKVDRQALTRLDAATAGDGETAELKPPSTPAEELLAGIFAQVLSLEQVGVDRNFFELGGHSLLATQVASRVRSVLGVDLPVRAVFEAPTVSGLAAAIETLRSTGAAVPDLPPLLRVNRSGPLPMSFAQERLWFLQQLDPTSTAYNMAAAVELTGTLRVDALAATIAEIVRRHDSLRTTFQMIGDTPYQFVSREGGMRLPLVDLAALPEIVAQTEAGRLAREHEMHVFDLQRGPLFLALLVRLSAASHRFLLNFHHAISDGWSLGVLVREVAALYTAQVEGRPAPLPELPIQYTDFAVWQREQLAERQAAELAAWEARLAAVAPGDLPTDRPRPAVQTFRGGRRTLALSADLTARLESFGRAEGATLFMTFLAATQALLARHTGEPDVPVGAPVAGRQWVEIEDLIGCFLNTLVLRTDLSGGPSFRELAARVRAVTLDAYANQTVPFEAVLARLQLQRDLSRNPLFQVLFNMLSLPAEDLSLPGLDLRILTPAEIPSKLDMTFYLSKAGPELWINLVYNADLFDEARMADLLAQLELLLEQAVAQPDVPLDSFPLLTAAARALLPDPAAAIPEPAFPPVARLFMDCAEALPEHRALEWREGAWTYAELADRAREIAEELQAAGAGPGTVVAVEGPRSPEMIARALGVFLAECVLLLLDPNLPEARRRAMLDEAKPGSQAGSLDAAYIFFTSGTTGRPKAVLGRQQGLSHFLTWQREELGIGPDDRAAQLTGLSFDVVLRDILVPLISGAALILPDEADLTPERILPWLAERKITMAHTVPTLASTWLSAAPPGFRAEALRWTLFAGEPLLDHVVERWREAFPRDEAVNLYGPTETTLAKCFYRVPDPPVARVQPVGSPPADSGPGPRWRQAVRSRRGGGDRPAHPVPQPRLPGQP